MTDPIIRADAYEQHFAEEALTAAETKDQLKEAWDRHCEHWPEGSAKERLRAVYAERFNYFAPGRRAG